MSEEYCGADHSNVEDALKHTYELLVVGGSKHLLSEPFWGTRGGAIGNIGKVIGWETPDHRLRWRLDYDPVKGVHINAEDFNTGRKIVHPVNIGYVWAATYWNKWTSRFDKPRRVLDAEAELLRQRREGFK